MTNLRVVLADFVRWAWIIQLLLIYFMVLVWHVTAWFIALKDPTPTQASILGLLIGMLPTLGTLFTVAAARIKPPEGL
jgi:hypothetical protein